MENLEMLGDDPKSHMLIELALAGCRCDFCRKATKLDFYYFETERGYAVQKLCDECMPKFADEAILWGRIKEMPAKLFDPGFGYADVKTLVNNNVVHDAVHNNRTLIDLIQIVKHRINTIGTKMAMDYEMDVLNYFLSVYLDNRRFLGRHRLEPHREFHKSNIEMIKFFDQVTDVIEPSEL